MDRLTYVGFGGYHNPRSSLNTNRLSFTGEQRNRVCIQLCKPASSVVSIIETNNDDRIAETDICHGEDPADRFVVAGTGKNGVKYYTDEAVLDRGPFVNKNLKIRLTNRKKGSCRRGRLCQLVETLKYTFKVINLSSLLRSEYVPQKNVQYDSSNGSSGSNGPDEDHAVAPKMVKVETASTDTKERIYCVLQMTNTSKLYSEDYCIYDRGQNTLQCNCVFCYGFKRSNIRETRIWKRMTDLPRELFINVLQFMHYDQVSWLADEDETFARKLAYHRYSMFDSFDPKVYPDKESVVRALRCKNAMEMRFNGDEDIWICSVKSGFPDGTCLNYCIKKGTYTWCKVVSSTALKFDGSRCMCARCIELLVKLKSVMNDCQTRTLLGLERCKVFALKGSENTPIDTGISSAFWEDKTEPKDFNYYVHMWTDNLDNNWLQGLREVDGSPITVKNYKMLRKNYFKTLIFKDPVKFFAVPKTLCIVDDNVVALLSSRDFEVLGYLIEANCYRFRVPVGEPQKIIGLNFALENTVSQSVYISELVRHVYSHDIDFTMLTLRDEATRLENVLKSGPLDADELRRNLDYIIWKLARLQFKKSQGSTLPTPSEVRREKPTENTLHVHETYSGDFEFCSRYLFEPLNTQEPDEYRRIIYDFLSSPEICADNSCNLNIVNKETLEACVAFYCKSSVRSMIDEFL